MAGVVRATARYTVAADGIEVYPDTCPAADAARKAAEKIHAAEYERQAERLAADLAGRGRPVPASLRAAPTYLRCTGIGADGSRRWCRYYYGMVRHTDETARIDLSMLGAQILESQSLQAHCKVLCMAQSRNRPPGL